MLSFLLLVTVATSVVHSTSAVGACYYKGTHYGEGQSWNDGCKQMCTCNDAVMGAYSCRARCLNWDSLPSVCLLRDPQPGLCCLQPYCSSGAIINIPTSYKAEYPSINGHHYQYVSSIVG